MKRATVPVQTQAPRQRKRKRKRVIEIYQTIRMKPTIKPTMKKTINPPFNAVANVEGTDMISVDIQGQDPILVHDPDPARAHGHVRGLVHVLVHGTVVHSTVVHIQDNVQHHGQDLDNIMDSIMISIIFITAHSKRAVLPSLREYYVLRTCFVSQTSFHRDFNTTF